MDEGERGGYVGSLFHFCFFFSFFFFSFYQFPFLSLSLLLPFVPLFLPSCLFLILPILFSLSFRFSFFFFFFYRFCSTDCKGGGTIRTIAIYAIERSFLRMSGCLNVMRFSNFFFRLCKLVYYYYFFWSLMNFNLRKIYDNMNYLRDQIIELFTRWIEIFVSTIK